jgi:hypothetical protein
MRGGYLSLAVPLIEDAGKYWVKLHAAEESAFQLLSLTPKAALQLESAQKAGLVECSGPRFSDHLA